MKYETEPWEWPEDLDPEDVLWWRPGVPPPQILLFDQFGLVQAWWRTLVADYNAWRSHR